MLCYEFSDNIVPSAENCTEGSDPTNPARTRVITSFNMTAKKQNKFYKITLKPINMKIL